MSKERRSSKNPDGMSKERRSSKKPDGMSKERRSSKKPDVRKHQPLGPLPGKRHLLPEFPVKPGPMDSLPIVDNILKLATSVEQYYAEGITEYVRELAAEAAQKAAEEELERQKEQEKLEREPSWGLLGDALAGQLIVQNLITRACQTDWKWHTMAVRWRHARFITTTIRKPRPPPTVMEVEPQKPRKTSHESLHEQLASVKAKHRHNKRFIDKGVDTNDLEFDPYDPHIVYTPILKPQTSFRSVRCSTIIHSWRMKTRRRLQHQWRSNDDGGALSSAISEESITPEKKTSFSKIVAAAMGTLLDQQKKQVLADGTEIDVEDETADAGENDAVAVPSKVVSGLPEIPERVTFVEPVAVAAKEGDSDSSSDDSSDLSSKDSMFE